MASETTVTVQSITARRKRRWIRGWMVWALLALAGAGGGYWYMTASATQAPQVRYSTSEVAKSDITVIVTAVGTVEPIEQVDVGSLISGTISEVDVEVNQTVTKGQILARLDTSSLQAELARVEATLTARKAEVEDARATKEAAEISLKKAQTLHAKDLNSQDDLDTAATTLRRAEAGLAQALAQVQVAEADVKLAQSNLAKAVIVAPIDGMVLDAEADLGQTVSASTNTVVLFTLAHDLGQMRLQVDVDEADIGKVSVGDAATFGVDAYLGEVFPAEVGTMHYAPTKVDGIVTYPTILTIDNSDKRLRPGMTASADITVETAKDVMTVPNSAFRYTPPRQQATAARSSGLLGMLFSGGAPGQRSTRQTTSVSNEVTKEGYRNLYVLRDGKPEQVAVKTGLTDGDLTEVLEGPLQLGDQVITAQSAAQK